MKNCNNCDYYVYDRQSGFCLCIHNENGNGYIRDAEHHACEKYKGNGGWLIGKEAMEICKTLIPWEKHRERELEYYSERYVESGIACPQCGAELLVDRWVVLTSYPPQRSYHCEKCKWQGTGY